MPHSSSNTYHLASVSGDEVLWVLRRNCSVSPRQLGMVFVMLCGVSLSVALFFWFLGATLVLPFAVVELSALAIAFVVYARHAADRECIRWCNGRLYVEWESAGRIERCEFAAHRVLIRAGRQRHRLVELQAEGKAVQVGRFLREELRPTLEREIRWALGRHT